MSKRVIDLWVVHVVTVVSKHCWIGLAGAAGQWVSYDVCRATPMSGHTSMDNFPIRQFRYRLFPFAILLFVWPQWLLLSY